MRNYFFFPPFILFFTNYRITPFHQQAGREILTGTGKQRAALSRRGGR